MELPAFLRRVKKPEDIGIKAPVYDVNTDTHVDTDTNRIVSERMADHMKMRDKGRREILGTESAVTKRTLLGVKVPPVPEHPVKHTPRQIFVEDPPKEEDDILSDIATGVAIAEVIADLSDLGSSDSGDGGTSMIDSGGGDFGGGGSDSSW